MMIRIKWLGRFKFDEKMTYRFSIHISFARTSDQFHDIFITVFGRPVQCRLKICVENSRLLLFEYNVCSF